MKYVRFAYRGGDVKFGRVISDYSGSGYCVIEQLSNGLRVIVDSEYIEFISEEEYLAAAILLK